MFTDLQNVIDRDGFTVLRGALNSAAVTAILSELVPALRRVDEAAGPIRAARETVYASRNLLRVWPGALDLARLAVIRAAVTDVLGPSCGLVRGLFFDKPPGRSWSLPWHKDMTIAVRDNRLAGTHFTKPTVKAGVPHVEAPESVLEQMLTARAHLDDVTEENGPLLVMAGSHRDGKTVVSNVDGRHRMQPVLVAAGDVLLMRPLVTHCSGKSRADTRRHRRIVHLEFASLAPLPDGFQWYEFNQLLAESTRFT